MSDPTKGPMICVDCGGSMTDDDLIAIAPGNGIVKYEHMNFSQCIASLNERIALATQRAEAAETERDAAIKRAEFAEADASKWLHDALIIAEGQRDQARAERDALRDQWSGLLIEQTRLMAMRDAAIAERDKLRTVDDAMVERFLRAYTECEGERPQTFTHRIGVRAALDAALAVQP